MREVKYVGPTKDIGRFGTVKSGQVIKLTEGEWRCVKDAPEYSLVGGTVQDDQRELDPSCLPFGSSIFDLRTIPWEEPTLFDRLCARASRRQLESIVNAMTLVGAAIPPINFDDNKIFVVDAIVSSSVNMAWDTLGLLRYRLPEITSLADGHAVIPEVKLDELRAGNEYVPPVRTPITGNAPVAKFPKVSEPGDAEDVSDQGGQASQEQPKEVKPPRKRKLLTTPPSTPLRKRKKDPKK